MKHLSFNVTHEFHKEFKMLVINNDVSMVELLAVACELLKDAQRDPERFRTLVDTVKRLKSANKPSLVSWPDS